MHSGEVKVRDDTYEFVSAVTHAYRTDRAALVYGRSDGTDREVSHIVAKVIIDIFQMICVNKKNAEVFLFLHIFLEQRKSQFLIGHPVIKSCQRIVDIEL